MKRFPGRSLFRSERFRRLLMIWSALALVGLGVLLLIAPRSAHGAEPIKVSTTANHWTTIGGVEFALHNGFDSIELKAGNYAQHVFVNGKAVFADKNLYQPPSARKQPDGRCALENSSFLLPLKEGDNDVVIAVANNFYGWGIRFRLDDVEGVRTAGL